ncbi:MAG: MGMT family protein, partial [Euryarchaeota archaeon]|nr:MGMT family protein [Euryarchaeota archaeon]MBU4454648.1 MGMT family protein [Euryarchaeota archaeon]
YGTTITYSELARRIGSRAVRAVGGVLARNPVPIIIPCHRVVAKNGIGGFSCGVDMKIKLIELELKYLRLFYLRKGTCPLCFGISRSIHIYF